MVFDPATLEGTAAVAEAYAAWKETERLHELTVNAPRKVAFAFLIAGAATAGVFAGLAAGLPSADLSAAKASGQASASAGDAGGLETAWGEHQDGLALRRQLNTAAGVSAGIGIGGFSIAFGISRSRQAAKLEAWEPWDRNVEK